MKLLVIGSTGGTGKLVVQEALDAGHHVVALARRPESLAVKHPRLTVIAGDVLDHGSLLQAMTGVDAVASALGIGGLLASRKAGTILSTGTGNILAAMDEVGVARLVVVSSVGVENDPTEELIYRHILKPFFLARLYEDMVVMEKLVSNSRLDWTLVRPPRLIDKAPTDAYHVEVGRNVPYARTLTRGDLARFIVRALGEGTYAQQIVGVSHETRATA